MDRVLQQFEQPVSDRDGELYDAYLYGRSRPGDTWQGWLVFERLSDRTRFATDVETTQPNAEAVLYWATGLTDAYFEGALERAKRPPQDIAVTYPVPPPVVGDYADSTTRAQRLSEIEETILAYFRRQSLDRVPTQLLMQDLPYAHADVVRAIEHLSKHGHLVERRTDQGTDWLFLTKDGIRITRNASRHDERTRPPQR
jgi:hypothetical protein